MTINAKAAPAELMESEWFFRLISAADTAFS